MSRSGEIFAARASALLIALIGLLVPAAPAAAQDPAAGLAEAETHVAQYEGELPGLQDQVSVAERNYEVAARRAAPSLRLVRNSKGDLRRLRRELAAQQRTAKGEIARLEDRRRQEADDHDQQVRSGVGFGLAALVAALIALGWGWFRATAPVAALTRIDLAQAIGLCVGGGLLMLIAGAALGGSNGAVGSLGSFLFCLGLILPTAFLLARHSAEVQRGHAKPLLRRERLPQWVSLATAGVMAILFLAGTGSAIFAGDASSEPIGPRLEAEAEAASNGDGAAEIAAARNELARSRKHATRPLAERNKARQELATARRELGHTQRRLAAAQASAKSFAHRLVAQEAREQREEEKQLARAQREEKELVAIQEEEQEEAEEEAASECDPNYSGCLDPNAPDYDCEGGSGDGPLYTGTVEVLGVDHYGLDSDGDGIGCE